MPPVIVQAAWRSPAVLAALREHASRVKELAEDRARMEAEVLERQKKLEERETQLSVTFETSLKSMDVT